MKTLIVSLIAGAVMFGQAAPTKPKADPAKLLEQAKKDKAEAQAQPVQNPPTPAQDPKAPAALDKDDMLAVQALQIQELKFGYQIQQMQESYRQVSGSLQQVQMQEQSLSTKLVEKYKAAGWHLNADRQWEKDAPAAK